MEVKMNKEIRDYQESMFWGLSFRQCLFSVLAILAALGIYFLTRKYAMLGYSYEVRPDENGSRGYDAPDFIKKEILRIVTK